MGGIPVCARSKNVSAVDLIERRGGGVEKKIGREGGAPSLSPFDDSIVVLQLVDIPVAATKDRRDERHLERRGRKGRAKKKRKDISQLIPDAIKTPRKTNDDTTITSTVRESYR